MGITQEIIRDVARTIVEHVQPEKVVLFGSCARGNLTADSDLDLLVIKESELRRDRRAQEIYRLFSRRQFPLDIVVYTPDEVAECLKTDGSFVKDILEHGRILYDRAA